MNNKLKSLALLLVCLFAATTSWAATVTFEVDGIYYSYNTAKPSVCVVTYRDNSMASYSGDVVIPESVTYNSMTLAVTEIGKSAFEASADLTSVTIPNSITKVGAAAFYKCYGLKSISFPNSVTEIGNQALMGCNNLEEVVLPEALTEIGSETFYGCDKLKAVKIPETVTKIGFSAFSGCNTLTEVVVPNSVTTMGSSVFEYAFNLKKVVLSENLKSIGNSLFHQCEALTDVNIPESLTVIPNGVFNTCKSLTSIKLHKYVTSVSWAQAFDDTDNLSEIIIDKENTAYATLGGLVYSKDFKTIYFCPKPKSGDIIVHKKVETVAERAFYYCQNLTSIMLPKNVTKIEQNAFSSVFLQKNFTDIYAYGPVPTTAATGFPANTGLIKDKVLHVLKGRAAEYKAASPWSRFTIIVDDLEEYAMGDSNHDRVVDVADAVDMVEKVVANKITGLDPYVTDMNDDNEFDLKDVEEIIRTYVKVDEE